MSETIADKLKAIGVELPAARPPAGNYAPTARCGDLLFVAGQIGTQRVGPAGPLAAGSSLDEARDAAAEAAVSVLGHISASVGGRVDAVRRIVKLSVFVAASSDFTDHPEVANAASDLMIAVFGDRGRHARTAVGAASLPRGAMVEIDAVIELAS